MKDAENREVGVGNRTSGRGLSLPQGLSKRGEVSERSRGSHLSSRNGIDIRWNVRSQSRCLSSLPRNQFHLSHIKTEYPSSNPSLKLERSYSNRTSEAWLTITIYVTCWMQYSFVQAKHRPHLLLPAGLTKILVEESEVGTL